MFYADLRKTVTLYVGGVGISEEQGNAADIYICAVCKTRALRRLRRKPNRWRQQHPTKNTGSSPARLTDADGDSMVLRFTTATANAAAKDVLTKKATSMFEYYRQHVHYKRLVCRRPAATAVLHVPTTPETTNACAHPQLDSGQARSATGAVSQLEQRRRKKSIPRCLNLADGPFTPLAMAPTLTLTPTTTTTPTPAAATATTAVAVPATNGLRQSASGIADSGICGIDDVFSADDCSSLLHLLATTPDLLLMVLTSYHLDATDLAALEQSCKIMATPQDHLGLTFAEQAARLLCIRWYQGRGKTSSTEGGGGRPRERTWPQTVTNESNAAPTTAVSNLEMPSLHSAADATPLFLSNGTALPLSPAAHQAANKPTPNSSKQVRCPTGGRVDWPWKQRLHFRVACARHGVSVSCSRYHTLAIDATGVAFACGNGEDGALGLSRAPSNVSRLSAVNIPPKTFGMVVQASAGDDCSCFVTADGVLLMVGTGEAGELGFGAGFEMIPNPKVLAIEDPRRDGHISAAFQQPRLKASFVSCGGQHTLVLAHGMVFSFGCGRDGQLGHGCAGNEFKPRMVKGLVDAKEHIVQIAAGGGHSVALGMSGAVFAWGHAEEGQLGIGQREGVVSVNVPTEVHNISGQLILSL